ncbi:hypothetical protein [Phytopseudomonas punonensis]|uniref:Uncharacterized protein n=1 Tax=Phytopseudomonas punonensis TaxID=1220495 RepID=A0A1M7FSZ1_9GAMM|nr:hypothetical protein [Pseudomonas punonensis]SHM07106.1 hypothetical protein SAMN05216288_2968 [Pseudomonas punonensis]
MKYIILMVVAFGGYYAYKNYAVENITVDSYQALLKEVETTEVTLEEVKVGSNMLADFFCNDAGFQKSGGSSVTACMNKLNNYREICESRIFDNAPALFTTKEQVKATAKSYAACTGSTG